eukprot:TRINITY_DN20037_c0_g2_i1.p3 TRINITY_DN20037_c0_g2~~TRINITY_DN20037_c0_g2_i1.p3  ORF type:complete len:196 (-),score=58.09 TRINITY_DN20037_c0_g2_i1:419-1006(-)
MKFAAVICVTLAVLAGVALSDGKGVSSVYARASASASVSSGGSVVVEASAPKSRVMVKTPKPVVAKKDVKPTIVIVGKDEKTPEITIVPPTSPEATPVPTPEPVSPEDTPVPVPAPVPVPEIPVPEPVPAPEVTPVTPEGTPVTPVVPTPTPSPVECTDVPPDAEYTCAEQAAAGRCDSPSIAGTDFCNLSCDKC